MNNHKKIFLNNITSKLSYHIVEQLRDDHINTQNYTYIIGSYTSKDINNKKYIHGSVSACVNYEEDHVLFGKYVMESDIIVMDVRNVSEEVQYILKLIQWKVGQENQSHQVGTEPKKQKVKIIAIGSHMCWAYTKTLALRYDIIDRQLTISKILCHNAADQQPLTQSSRNSTTPHHSWIHQRQIQNRIIKLNQYSTINTCLITTGLVYGKNIASQQLQDIISRCYSIKQDVYIYGDGNNILPLVHIDQLSYHIQYMIKYLDKNDKKCPNCVISVDQQFATQIQIVQQLLKCSGYKKQIKKLPLLFLTKQQSILSQSIYLKKSQFLPTNPITTIYSNFIKYWQNNQIQINQYINLQPMHLILYIQQHDIQLIKKLDKQLNTVIYVFRQQDIWNQLCKQKNITRQQIDIHQLSYSIQHNYLKKHQRKNYLLILNHILLHVDVVKQHNMVKFDIVQDATLLLSHKYPEYVLNQSQNINSQLCENNLVMKIYQKQKNNAESIDQLDSKIIKQKQFNYKFDQYLLDNITNYLSQAYYLTKDNPNLSNFINALKTIYKRESQIQICQ